MRKRRWTKEVAVVMIFIKQEKMDSENNRQCMQERDYIRRQMSRVDY